MTEEREEKKDLTVLGKVVGTYTGWDGGSPGECFIFYNFVPNELGRKWLPSLPVFDTPFHCLLVDYDTGEVLIVKEEWSGEMVMTEVDWSVFNLGVAKGFSDLDKTVQSKE